MTGGAYSVPEVRRLLATLVASKPGGRIGECGTSYGDGALAMAEALAAGATLVTAEIDATRARAARARLAPYAVEVLDGRWQDVLPARAPFDLLFADAGDYGPELFDLLAPGGVVVKDDLDPDRPDRAGDPVRRLFLDDRRLATTEILVSPRMAVIVGVRRAATG